MSITIVNGDLLNSHCDYICHQVNCMGKMNSGVAKAIREKWPKVYEDYVQWHLGYDAWARAMPGEVQTADAMLGAILVCHVNPEQAVINMAAQGSFGYDGRRYTSYDAFWICLGHIKHTVAAGSSIAFPYGIGSVRGGANWNVIRTMIEEVLGEDYEVYIYKLED